MLHNNDMQKKAFYPIYSTICRVVPTFHKHDLANTTNKFSLSINILCKCIGTGLVNKSWILL